jgi:O-antigen ligase
MPEHIGTLIIILSIATSIFVVAKKHIEPLLNPGEYVRWRNAWIIITLIAFLSGNFWIYILATGLFVRYAIKPIENRFAFFLAILFVVPVISARLGPLFYIDYVSLLSLVILLPILFSTKFRQDAPRLGSTLADFLVIFLIILMTLLEMRGTTFTDAIRNGIGYFLTIFLPYFVASRAIKDFKQLKIAIIGFTLAGMIAGSIAIFEYIFQWLLYNPLANALQAPFPLGAYLGRGDSLRALASLGHPLVLGLTMVITFGLYLFVAPSIKNKWMRWLCQLAILGGLIAPVSRGPWVAAAALFFIFIALGPKVVKKMSVAMILTVLVGATLPVIPGGEKVINLLPFVGNVDPFNVDYREVLFDRGLLIVQREPLFGVPEPSKEPEMEDMVQGEGIVDIVNSYLNIVLGYGVPGLMLYIGFFLTALYRVNKSRKKIKDKTSDEYLCGRALIATMVAVLLAIFSTSSIGAIPTIIYSLAGIMFSYARIIDKTYKKKSFGWKSKTVTT